MVKKSASTDTMAENLADMLKALLEDHQRRDEELAEERRRRAEELQEERRRRDEEAARREEEVRQQMDLLRGLVEGVQQQGQTAAMHAGRDKDVKVAKLTDDDDIEAYLTTFERLMKAYEIKEERWAFKLAPQLVGKAQQAYAAMRAEDSGDYAEVKKAILRRYDVNEETYRRRFRSIRKRPGETNRELVARLEDLAKKWTIDCESVEQIRDIIVLEQIINALPEEVRVWVRERKPKTSEEAGQLADDYAQARRQTAPIKPNRQEKSTSPVQCSRCKKRGHLAQDCWSAVKQEEKPDGKERGGNQPVARPKKDLKDIECFNCHKKGHFSSNCPANALLCMERRTGYTGDVKVRAQPYIRKQQLQKTGRVEGKEVSDILLDTGCSRTLVRQDLVPTDKLLEGEVVAIRCAHGDTVLYPLAQVEVAVGGQQVEVEAAVSTTLPMSVLLGTDVPQLGKLLDTELTPARDGPNADAFAVTTRAQRQRQQEEEAHVREREETSGAIPNSLGEPEFEANEDALEEGQGKQTGDEEEDAVDASDEGWTVDFDDEIFKGGREKPRLTRGEKRNIRQEFRRQNGTPDEESERGEIQRHPLDFSAGNLQQLQEEDSSLQEVRRAADSAPPGTGPRFYREDGLIFRRWTPPGCNTEDMAVDQLVLPLECRKQVLELAHSVPLAGHLGKEKTARRILQRFYWPTLYRDVAVFCRHCEACQKAAPSRNRHAPLIPLPIIDEPFQRIAMDIVGPLPRSRSGMRYVLVVCDYATRYPEAIPLKSMDAEHVAEELVVLFSRVGVPKEILTDQGTNFTSKLLTEIYRMLHVHPIRTTPYHPQTDGLVERFNKTLKWMLRKAAVEEGKDWDKLIPYVLFAYREVPQASTGFSPFELLYGRTVRGPLDVLKEAWCAEKRTEESIVSHVLSMRGKMEKMMELVKENLSKSQGRQKQWYDKKAYLREFHPGDQVLVLLPTSASKLMARWQGPYRVLKRMGRVTYQVDMHDHRKRKRTFHVNMLSKFHVPELAGYTEACVDEEDDGIMEWNNGSTSGTEDKPAFGEQLTTGQQAEMEKLLTEFESIMGNRTGRTDITEHDIQTGHAPPVRLPPYRLPHAYRDQVKEQLKEMLKEGVIEPSMSEWSAPIVLVKKKDGTLRLCVDYRRLNEVSVADAYPMPRIDDLIDRLGKAVYITTMDLTRGYWQVPVTKGARPKTAFATPFGLYQFNVMPFGLQGAPATFQRLMDGVTRGLDYAEAYLDDLIIFSESWDEHISHLRTVLQRLREAGLTIKSKKCCFGMSHCSYLGHVVGGGTVRPEPHKITAVASFPAPQTKKQVRVFLGLTGYYRRFIPNYASLAAPLTDLTRKDQPTKVIWNQTCEEAFQSLKNQLCSSPILHNPDFERTFTLQTDASDRGVGAVLSQQDDEGNEHPIAYFSRKFLPREQRYSTVEKECLAIKLGVQAFRVYLLGRPFHIQTDHRALIWLDRLKENNARLTRWSLSLQPYNFQVTYRSGKANANADALSRASVN